MTHRDRSARWRVLVTAWSMALLAALAPASAAVLPGREAVAASVTPIPGELRFIGRGWGHGVGMSQYGARGRALDGQTADQIVRAYFKGATTATRSDLPAARVLVLSAFTPSVAKPFRIIGRGGTWRIAGVADGLPADASLGLAWETGASGSGWRLSVTDASGGSLLTRFPVSTLDVQPASAATVLQLWSKSSTYDRYRGTLRVRPTTTTISVINVLDLESYLRGVVPAEMPSSWPAAALRAQAIAARSYAARRLHPTTGTYDLYDDSRSQVYRGVTAERSGTDAAIAATARTILTYGSEIVNALFHSTAGGWTENNENVFVSSSGAKVAGPVPYLRGIEDVRPDGSSYDAASPYASWQTASYPAASLSAIFERDSRTAVGTLTGWDLSDRGVSGRLISVTLVGTAATKKVSGDVFRSVFEAGRPASDPPMRGTLVYPEAVGPQPVLGPESTYVPLGPVRLLDSRIGLGLSGTFSAKTPRVLQLAGRGGIPAGATAVTVNLTIVGQTAPGYVALTPTPTAAPATSTLNVPAGDTRANGATVPLGPDGSLALVYMAPAGARTHLLLDVTGYYLAGAGGATYVPLGPVRLLDSRIGLGLSGTFSAKTPRVLKLAGRGGIPAGATAVTVNLTIVGQTAPGYVALTPTPTAAPATSTLNVPAGDTRANGATVPLGPDGSLALVYMAPAGARTHLLLDVTGYYLAGAGGATYVPLGPVRLLDSRIGLGLSGTFSAKTPRVLQLAGRGGIPAGATAVTVNLTIVGQTAPGYVALTPTPTAAPATSTLNVPAGDTRANGATVPLGPDGSLALVYMAPAGARTHLLLDVTGFFR